MASTPAGLARRDCRQHDENGRARKRGRRGSPRRPRRSDLQARAADWQFGQFFPASCTACDDEGQTTALVEWRLANDSTVREAFYQTDGNLTNRFFNRLHPWVPGRWGEW
jgi:hypothetical protein